MKISLLIPSYNEERSLGKCLEQALSQTRPLDEIIVVNDGSTDNTQLILESIIERYPIVRSINLPSNTGNKSKAQKEGLKKITGDIVIMTDADTLMDSNFVALIAKEFENDTQELIAAIGGYVVSLKHNWMTACREIDYIIGQNIFKKAQSIIDYVYVMPGCATAIRTPILKELIFNHDTVTEDLDFTFQLHLMGLSIDYNMDAKVYTQDPPNLSSYIRQMKRWYGGGWQNIRKYWPIIFHNPSAAFVLGTIFIDGIFFSLITIMTPIFSPVLFFTYLLPLYFFGAFIFTTYAAVTSRRYDLMFYFPHYVFIIFVNALIMGYEFFREIVFNKCDLVWRRADRVVTQIR